MTSAQHNRDFPGWPNCPKASSLATIKVNNRSFTLDRDVAPLFKAALTEVVERGYLLDRGDQLDDWSFSCRQIRGSLSPSEHSRGTAIDINAVHNPMKTGALITDMPSWVPATFAKYGISWGGNYPNRHDTMHYEFLGSRHDAQVLSAALAGKSRPPAPPAPTSKPKAPLGSPMLKVGDHGVVVRAMQTALRYATGRPTVADGIFGDDTQAALVDFQRFFGLTPDGIYGPQAAKALTYSIAMK